MDEELNYVSTSPDLQSVQRDVKPQDVTDMPTLERVLVKLNEWEALYMSVDSLTVDEKPFTVTQQLALNQKAVLMARELKLMVETTISDVKEKYKDG